MKTIKFEELEKHQRYMDEKHQVLEFMEIVGTNKDLAEFNLCDYDEEINDYFPLPMIRIYKTKSEVAKLTSAY